MFGYYIFSLYYWFFPSGAPIEINNPNEVARNLHTSVLIARNNILTPSVSNDPFLNELKYKLSSPNKGLRTTLNNYYILL